MEKKINHNAIPPCRRLCRRQVDLRKKRGKGGGERKRKGGWGFGCLGGILWLVFSPFLFLFLS